MFVAIRVLATTGATSVDTIFNIVGAKPLNSLVVSPFEIHRQQVKYTPDTFTPPAPRIFVAEAKGKSAKPKRTTGCLYR